MSSQRKSSVAVGSGIRIPFSVTRHNKPPLQWAPGLFLGGEADGVWWWPPTSSSTQVVYISGFGM